MNKNELIYLASPYTHLNPLVMEERFKAVCKIAAMFMAKGFYILSPIAHTHPIAMAGKLPVDWQYWEGYDTTIIKCCKCLLVLKLEGWKDSTGVKAEIKIAEELGVPVEYVEYDDSI